MIKSMRLVKVFSIYFLIYVNSLLVCLYVKKMSFTFNVTLKFVEQQKRVSCYLGAYKAHSTSHKDKHSEIL